MRILLIITILLSGISDSLAQKNKTEGHIYWSEDKQLTWDDFQAKPRKNHFASAMSDITFSVSINTQDNKMVVYIQPSFDPKGSWVKEEDKTENLLKHEKIHFDIYEVNARKLRQEIKSKKLTSTNVESIVNSLIEKYREINVKLQERYDEETEHSMNEYKQKKWNESVATDLLELTDYKEAEFTIIIELK